MWTDFKSRLTRTYIYGTGDKDGVTTPVDRYPSITADIWEQFVKSRKGDVNFEVKFE